MKIITRCVLLWTITICCSSRLEAQSYETNDVAVQTFVGSGFYGYYDGEGVMTMFYNPTSLVVDNNGNFLVWDSSNYRVRKITPGGTVSTYAGGGQVNPPAYTTNVILSLISSGAMIIDHVNTLWIANYYSYPSYNLLRIGADGLVWPIAMNGLPQIQGLCVDSKNNLYLSGTDNRIYRYATNGVLEVFVGSGNPGAVDGNGIFNSFSSPAALIADAADNIYVWDSGTALIRRINQNRDVMTFAGSNGNFSNADGVGTNAAFGRVQGMGADGAGNILLTCASSYYGSGSCVRQMTPGGQVTTIAGSFTQNGYANGTGSAALFDGAGGICVAAGKIYVADSNNQRIRSITCNPTNEPVQAAALELNTYPGLKISGTVGRAYGIESSADMTHWQSAATIVLPASPHIWIDQNPVSGNKFYRAFLLP